MAVKKEKFIELISNGEPILINTDMIQCVKIVNEYTCQITVGNLIIRVEKSYREIKDILLGNKTLNE